MSNKILFYKTGDPYGFLSNFAKYPITINGRLWPTSEHYFQAQKFAGTEHEEAIRELPTARQAADYGRDRSKPLREDWEANKNYCMLQALRHKFSRPDLRQMLLDTGTVELVEHTEIDSYWGDGGDGTGKNMLGVLLMWVREEIANEEAAKAEGRSFSPPKPATLGFVYG